MSFIRICFSFIISLLMGSLVMSSAAVAQDNGGGLTINDIAGEWEIEVIDRPFDAFKGSANVPRIKDNDGKTVMAETITEDKCCNGNHARVLQESRITIEGDEIIVDSEIVKYLKKIERIPAHYSADSFRLKWEGPNLLVGTANGYIPVRWFRGEMNIS